MLLNSRWEKPEAQSSEYIYNEYLKCISTNISMHFQFVNTIYVICTVCLHIVVCIWILLSDTRKGHKSNSLAHHSLLHHHHHRLSLVKALLLYYQTEKLLRQRILLCWTLPKRSWTQSSGRLESVISFLYESLFRLDTSSFLKIQTRYQFRSYSLRQKMLYNL